jgi:UPF0755 protein
MKTKIKTGSVIIAIAAFAVLFVLFKFLGPAASKPEKKFLYIKTGTEMEGLKKQLVDEKILGSLMWFNTASNMLDFKKVKPGKYNVSNGMSVFNLVRMLRNGTQTPVAFVVTKIRTKEQLAAKIGNDFECDSLTAINFLNNNDSLKKYGLDSNNAIAAVLPLTYSLRWNTSFKNIYDNFYTAYKKFWNEDRKQKAAGQVLSINQVITMASIIDEETNATKEKSNIASVYMNRITKGMPLQADPTIKFALKDFSIKRILFKHLAVVSAYNTYKNKGLPPGPICTPMEETIDAVLNAPKTDYLYFVASPNFDGTHIFSTSYEEHHKHATEYQKALDEKFGKIKSETTRE